MAGKQEAVLYYRGIEIVVVNDITDDFSVYFSNQPGSFEPLGNTRVIRGKASVQEGVLAGMCFVDEHQWEEVVEIGIFTVSVRLWWDGSWGYGVHSEGSGVQRVVAGGKKEAVAAGIEQANEMIEALKKEVALLRPPE